MYCPACGKEYTLKTNYCKRCGENLSISTVVEPPKMPRLSLVIMFCTVAIFGILGLIMLILMYSNLYERGARGDELKLPFMLGMTFVGAISGLLVWQLVRMMSTFQRINQNAVVERHFIREVPQAQLSAPPDQIPQPVEYPSVVEQTTRQFADISKEVNAPK